MIQRACIVFSIVLIHVLYAAPMTDGQSINGVTYDMPWYEIKNVAGDATIFLIDKDGDMYLDADAIAVSSAITGPFANSLIIEDAGDEIFVINAANAYFSGKVYPNFATLPTMDGDDMVIQNVAGTPVAIFDGGDNSLYLSGNATHDAVTVEPRNALAFAGATRAAGSYPAGTHEHVVLPSMAIDFSAGITFEGWFYFDALQNWAHPVSMSDGTNSFQILHHSTNATLRFNTVNSTSSEWIEATGIIDLNSWIHIAYTVTPTGGGVATGRLYKNGLLIDTDAGQRSFPNTTWTTGMLAWGSGTDGNMSFDGKLDEFRLWNDVRSQSEIQADMFTTYGTLVDNTNLAAYWDFNDVLGSQLIDAHSGSFHGTLQDMNSDAWQSTFGMHTLTVSNGGNGSISPSGATTVAETQTYPITATPDAGYVFDSWTKPTNPGNCTIADDASASTTVVLTGDGEVQANFIPTPNNCLDFLGATNTAGTYSGNPNQYVDIPDLNFQSTGSYTVEAWIKWDALQNNARPLLFRGSVDSVNENGSSDGFVIQGVGSGTTVRFGVYEQSGAGAQLDIGSYITTGTWTHVALSAISSGKIIAYKNGAKMDSATTTAFVGDGATVFNRIASGTMQANDESFDGQIDQVRIWTDIRTQAEIKADMFNEYSDLEASDNLLAYWDFNSVSGDTLFESTGTYDGVLTDMANDDWVSSYSTNILTIASSTNGSVSPSGAKQLGDGWSKSVIATADAGYNFQYWAKTAGSGTVVIGDTTAASTTITVTGGDATVTAYFDYTTWANNSTITLNTTEQYANVTSTKTDFPVLIRLTTGDFTFANARGNGEDVRFTTAADVPIDYEIERWDSTNALAEIWVNVPSIAANSTTDIKMFWGRAEPVSESDGEAVYLTAGSYQGVWHLGEEGDAGVDGFKDATSNNYDLSGSNLEATDDVEGVVGKGISFDGVDEYIQRNHVPVSAYPFTFSGWVKSSNSTDGSGLVFLGDIDVTNEYCQLVVNSAGYADARARNTTAYGATSSRTVDDGNWHHLVAVFSNATTRKIYVDGVLENTESTSVTVPAIDRVAIGRRSSSSPTNYTNGVIDEVHIANATRGAQYVKLAFENQRAENYLINPRTSRTLTLGAGTGGSVANSGGNVVYDDAVFTLSATPAANYVFTNWTKTAGAGIATIIDADAASTTVRITGGDVTLQANFTSTIRTITVTNDGNGSNVPTGGQTVNDLQNLSIRASLTVDNMEFNNWTVTSGSATIADANAFSTTVNVNGGDATVRANYKTIVGNYLMKPRHSTNKCADVSGGVGNQGDDIQQYDCNGSNAQTFAVEEAVTGWHGIKTITTWRVWDRVVGGNGSNINLWDFTIGATNRQWKFVPVGTAAADEGYYRIVSRNDGKCADVSGYSTSNGATIHMWDCNTADNQEFKFVRP
ncbi:MAG: DUF2341 domain-containing protein [Fibrobacterales bacterium]